MRIIGGKQYEWGHVVTVFKQHRMLYIEFDSDYGIKKIISAKNFDKKAAKEIAKIPELVTPEWFVNNGWDVPKEIL